MDEPPTYRTTSDLVVREGVDKESKRKPRPLPAGATVRILQSVELDDGSRRSLVITEDQATLRKGGRAEGWVTTHKDGNEMIEECNSLLTSTRPPPAAEQPLSARIAPPSSARLSRRTPRRRWEQRDREHPSTPEAEASQPTSKDDGTQPAAIAERAPRNPQPGAAAKLKGAGAELVSAFGAPEERQQKDATLVAVVDTLFETLFPLLYAFEPDGMLDSEKNLRVLWVRALLAAAGELQDDVAAQLLPAASRWIVSAPLARTIWAPALPKLEWIKQRTEFIDTTLDGFLATHASSGDAQVVLIGAGYDTRALRYRDAGATFYEVDLPTVLPIKEGMATRFLVEAGGAKDGNVGAAGRALGVDLNKATMAPPGVFAQLEALGLDRSRPTLIVSEAVLFYLSPPAKRALLADASAFVSGAEGSSLVLTDNLAPFVRGPMRPAAEAFLSPLGLDVQTHDTLWGGAIQFLTADGGSAEPPPPMSMGPPPGTPGGPPGAGGPPPGTPGGPPA